MTADAFCWNRRVATRTLDGTAFILIDSRMVSLNEVGSHMWSLFQHGATVEQVCDQVVAIYEAAPDEVLRDTREFVLALAQRGMLVAVGTSEAAPVGAQYNEQAQHIGDRS